MRRAGPALWSVALLVCPSLVLGLDPERSIPQYTQEVWSDKEGFADQPVYAVAQTPDGYLWFGTGLGLVRFDGVRFVTFEKANTPALRNDTVWALGVDGAGTLWAGTYGGGLVRVRDGRPTPDVPDLGQDPGFVWAVTPSRAGGVYVGTEQGVYRVQDASARRLVSTDGAVRSLYEDRSGRLWIGGPSGLARAVDGRAATVSAVANVLAIHGDGGDGLWLGTPAGLQHWGDGRLTRGVAASDRHVTAISADGDGNLWIATDGGGILRRTARGRLESYSAPEGLPNPRVMALAVDREGSLWIGARGGGLVRLKDGDFATLTSRQGLSEDYVTALCEDRDGRVWIGTVNGLNRWDGRSFRRYSTADGLSNAFVRALHADPSGSLWVGTDGGGLNRLGPDGRITVFAARHGLPHDIVAAVVGDERRGLWIATQGGLARLADGKLVALGGEDAVADPRALMLDRRGRLWVGGKTNGLGVYDKGVFRRYGARDGLAHGLVLSLYEDERGVVWFGTGGGGLHRLEGDRVTVYDRRTGLLEDAIYSILEHSGDLWMSGLRGVFRVSRAALDAVAEGRSSKVTAVAYGTMDGMKSAQCTGGFQPAGIRTRDGRLWFPTIRGVAVVDPGAPRAEAPPPVRIEEVLVDQNPIDFRSPVSTGPGSGQLEVRYTALGFRAPERIRFRYRLEGFDRAWVEAGPRRTAFYTNLPHGRYRFVATASAGDGPWTASGASFDFALRPHFYERPWFTALGLLAVFAAAVSAHRLRVASLKRRARELARRVEEAVADQRRRAAELEEAFRSLQEHQERLVVAEKMASLGRLTAGIAHEIATPIAAVRGALAEIGHLVEDLESGDHDRLCGEIQDARRLAERAAANAASFVSAMKARTRGLGPAPCTPFDPLPVVEEALAILGDALGTAHCTARVERLSGPALVCGVPGHLVQIVSNLVTNAIDALAPLGGGPISIRLRTVGERVELAVEDGGCGIPAEVLPKIYEPLFTTKPFGQGTGLGLTIVHDMVTADFGGSLSVESRPNVGTTVTISFPMHREAAR